MAHLAFGEYFVLGDPFERLLKSIFGITFEYDPFARTPAPCIHPRVKTFGELVGVVMSVEFRSQVDFNLCLLESGIVFANVVGVGIGRSCPTCPDRP